MQGGNFQDDNLTSLEHLASHQHTNFIQSYFFLLQVM